MRKLIIEHIKKHAANDIFLFNTIHLEVYELFKGSYRITRIIQCLYRRVQTRCHNAFWSVEEFIPDWVKDLSADDLVAAIRTRIQTLVSATSGK